MRSGLPHPVGAAMYSPTILVIGLDGFDYSWSNRLGERAYYSYPLFSPKATSSAGWTTLMTGLPAETHRMESSGITEWVRRSQDLKYIWDYLSAESKRSVIVNLPFSYPPRAMNGTLVCGVPAHRDRFVFPSSKIGNWNWSELDIHTVWDGPSLNEPMTMDFRELAWKLSDMRWALSTRFLLEVEQTYTAFAMICFTGLDRLAHFQPDGLGDHLDEVIDSILATVGILEEKLAPEWIFVVSDHGINLKSKRRDDGWSLAHGEQVEGSFQGVFAYKSTRAQPLPKSVDVVDMTQVLPTWLKLAKILKPVELQGQPLEGFVGYGEDETNTMLEQLSRLGYVESPSEES